MKRRALLGFAVVLVGLLLPNAARAQYEVWDYVTYDVPNHRVTGYSEMEDYEDTGWALGVETELDSDTYGLVGTGYNIDFDEVSDNIVTDGVQITDLYWEYGDFYVGDGDFDIENPDPWFESATYWTSDEGYLKLGSGMPGSIAAVSTTVDSTCTYGYYVDIAYQLYDTYGLAWITYPGLQAYESVSATFYYDHGGEEVSSIDKEPNLTSTDDYGMFDDVPFGACTNFDSGHGSGTQTIYFYVNSVWYAVRTNSLPVTATSGGNGSVSNGVDAGCSDRNTCWP